MKLSKIYLILIFLFQCLIQAQYMGGNGRGDVSVILSNVLLPVQKTEDYIPAHYDLDQNYPNPFNPSTKIKYQIPELSFVTIKVFDVLGNEVATLVDEYKPAGKYEVEFKNHSDEGQNLPSGVYFYQLRVEDPETSSGHGFVETKKMILLK